MPAPIRQLLSAVPGKSGCSLVFLAACLLFSPLQAAGRILDTATGQAMTPADVQARIKDKHFVLLGELHDNAVHHATRGELIAMLRPAAVVAEHLMRGQGAANEASLPALEAAGFDSRSWRWPLHETLFSAIVGSRTPLIGGNLPKPLVRQIAREGESAMPGYVAALLSRFPLGEAAAERLDRDLVDGHCGQLPPAMLPGLRQAQRVRDAAMATSLSELQAPAVLVAGNGHVRRDYGVPTLLARMAPERSLISIGFVEEGPALADRLPQMREQYDIVWITTAAERNDPCQSLRQNAPR
jgi:uncharacterized iron-regulated protein